MRGLIKGDNVFVPTAVLRVAVRNDIDVAALLVTERGRVRGDADIVFDGAPVHPSGAVRLSDGGDGGEDGTVWVDADLTGVEQEISRVLVVASTEGGALRDVRDLSVRVLGPDGTTVVGYEVTEAGGETAMVLAELYRRAGGWKFRAVGQGYLDGLVGLAADHGVDVAEEAAEAPPEDSPAEAEAAEAETRTPEAPQVPVPAQAPVPTPLPAPAKLQVPSRTPDPVPYAYPPVAQGPSGWTFGAVFEPRTLSGPGNAVLDVEDLPPGPVMVELTLKTDGYTGVWTLGPENKEMDLLVNSTEQDFRGRLLHVVPETGRLRMKLRADGPWQARVLPLAAAQLLTEETMESWGPNVLLHTGGPTDVAFHYRGSSNFIVDSYDLAGHDDPTTLPDSLRPYINQIGRRRESLSLPEGPVLVHLLRAAGPWRARLKQPSAATAWLRRARR
ncbi:TerD family protein [Streptomyces sp. NBC_00094]|uniref:TerD family protein n=1 Tax=Streptomyces sp. NBC_00094 TaxID=2903620 RepID=UPI002252D615|nr:TerD family protein [Streptomyces sp. NBC_00094]MCX5392777.1 TerD family protein [Streptomyces sp. NBC_00094]